ncbi:hypothetical protein [Demequina litorisediminis]|uniref:hypothetical protein n=1 Tax=Demequina litorisediminis TaxID=1849022 RepID=UPI0024E16FC9|nr:hypothetical protein [Demequina litorisediminis]
MSGSSGSIFTSSQARRRRFAGLPRARTLAAALVLGFAASVLVTAAPASAAPTPVVRINAGGGTVAATDAGPDWAADDGATWTNGAALGYDAVEAATAVTPVGDAPAEVFQTARSGGGSEPMAWSIPAAAGSYEVRLYLASLEADAAVGASVIEATAEGKAFVSGLDVVAAAGPAAGYLASTAVTSDGTIDVAVGTLAGSVAVSAVEVLALDAHALAAAPAALGFGQVDVGSTGTASVDVSLVGATEGAALEVTDVSDGFTATPSASALSADGTVSVDLAFSPTEAGTFSGTVTLAAGDATTVIGVSGVGVAVEEEPEPTPSASASPEPSSEPSGSAVATPEPSDDSPEPSTDPEPTSAPDPTTSSAPSATASARHRPSPAPPPNPALLLSPATSRMTSPR